LLERALPIFKKHYGPDHFKEAIVLVNLSIAYCGLGNYKEQKELLERALPFLEGQDAESFEFGILLVNLDNAYMGLHNPNKAKELVECALPIVEKHYGSEHVQVANVLIKLGATYEALGDPNKAKELLERALPVVEKHNHPVVTNLREQLNKLNIFIACFWK
jgi:tetratricopeptide (TPR) repeat protein